VHVGGNVRVGGNVHVGTGAAVRPKAKDDGG
jgi:hypothetical protein